MRYKRKIFKYPIAMDNGKDTNAIVQCGCQFKFFVNRPSVFYALDFLAQGDAGYHLKAWRHLDIYE